jgi:hypothetical protein
MESLRWIAGCAVCYAGREGENNPVTKRKLFVTGSMCRKRIMVVTIQVLFTKLEISNFRNFRNYKTLAPALSISEIS